MNIIKCVYYILIWILYIDLNIIKSIRNWCNWRIFVAIHVILAFAQWPLSRICNFVHEFIMKLYHYLRNLKSSAFMWIANAFAIDKYGNWIINPSVLDNWLHQYDSVSIVMFHFCYQRILFLRTHCFYFGSRCRLPCQPATRYRAINWRQRSPDPCPSFRTSGSFRHRSWWDYSSQNGKSSW